MLSEASTRHVQHFPSAALPQPRPNARAAVAVPYCPSNQICHIKREQDSERLA